MKVLAVFTALNYSGSFGKNFAKFQKKNKNVAHRPWSVRIGKTCASVLRAQFFLQQHFPIRQQVELFMET